MNTEHSDSSEPGGDWTEIEIKTFLRRQQKLERMGMTMDESEKFAQRLLYRDRPGSGDDRKLCLECRFFKAGRCDKKHAVLPFILQRCDGFKKVGV